MCRILTQRTVTIFLIAFAAMSGIVNAQTLYGSLTGAVLDPSQAVVPNAKVEAENTSTGVKYQAATNEVGIFAFNDLQPGIYKVTITGTSFAAVVREGVMIEANRQRRLDVSLQVAQVTETVQVSGAAQLLQTDRADLNTNLTSKQVTDLPVTGSMGRNFQSMMALVPGVIMGGEQNSDAGNPQRAISFNANGVSRLQNNTRLDGSTIIYPWLPTNIAYVPSVEAIEVVNIVTNAYNAEQGIAGGAAVNIILKSGTNDYHGTGWGFNTNSHFKARNYFLTTPQNPKLILNQFGLNFGGPVWIPKVFNGKNKLFFFVNWERTTRRQLAPPRFFSIAPDDLRAGDFTATGTTVYDPTSNTNPALRTPFPGNRVPSTRFDIAAIEMMKLMPAPNVAGAGYVNNFVGAGSAPFDRDNIDIKVNERVTDKFSYFGRYSISPHNALDPPIFGKAVGDATFGGQLGQAPGRIQVGGAGATYTFSPTLLLDVSLGYTRQRLGAQGPDIGTNYGLDLLKIPDTNGADFFQSGMPAFQFNSTWSNLGNANTGSPFIFRDNQYVASVNLGWVRSKHSFRFGWDYMNQQINHFQPQGGTFQTTRGTFVFDGNAASLQNGAAANRFNSWAAFLLGLPNRAGKVEQLRNPNSLRIQTYALYAQDQWQATRNLTINLGARWERFPFPTRDWGGVSRFDPADGRVYIGGAGSTPLDTGASAGWGQIVPRIGLAYRLGNRTVIRSGYGISTDPRTFIDFRNAFPINFAWEIPQPQNPYVPVTTLRQGLQASVYRQPLDLNQPFIVLQGGTGTVTVPQEIRRKYIQSWNFVVQHEIGGFVAQAGYVGTRATGQMNNININAAAPGAGTSGRALFPRFGLSGDINMVMPYHTTTYDGLQTQLTRRWGSSMWGAVYAFSKNMNWADNDGNPRIQYLPEAGRNRGPASYDRTHVFQSYFVAESPFGKGKPWASSGISRAILEGWQLNGVLTAESGQPVYVIQNNANNLNAPGSQQVPDQIKQDVAILGGVGPGRPWFDTSAFAAVNIPANQPQRFGNAGRNNIRGPNLVNLDTGLFRTVNLTERVHLQFRAEALNVLNHPNFSLGLQFDGNNNISDLANFGIINYTIGANNATGFSGKGTGERQFRFAIRLYF